jgi:hypothetical protein
VGVDAAGFSAAVAIEGGGIAISTCAGVSAVCGVATISASVTLSGFAFDFGLRPFAGFVATEFTFLSLPVTSRPSS